MAPTVLAAKTRGIPRVVHEANVTLEWPIDFAPASPNSSFDLRSHREETEHFRPVRGRWLSSQPKDSHRKAQEALAKYGLNSNQPVLTVVGGLWGRHP